MCADNRRTRALLRGIILSVGATVASADIRPVGDTTVAQSALFNTYVGKNTAGTLTIDSASVLSDTDGYLGFSVGSSGIATVTGGSKWANSGALYVGYAGTGQLNLNSGGAVTATTLFAALNDLAGDGTITAAGAVLDGDLYFDNFHGSSRVFTFGTGGTLTLSATGDLGAGFRRTGNLSIADGISVTSRSGTLGYDGGSTGVASISGAGSKWTVTGPNGLDIGRSGNGALTVTGGGTVSTLDCYLGHFNGSTGIADVSGSGSKLIAQRLYVSAEGTGTLRVSAGGSIDTQNFFGAINKIEGNGNVTASGGLFDDDLTFDGATKQDISFGSGGKFSLNLNTGILGVGDRATGTMRIAGGAVITSASGSIGKEATSTGSVIVTGAGTTWATNGLEVGSSGSGTLLIERGASVSGLGSIASHELASRGAVTIRDPGSKWTATDFAVGNQGKGSLRIADGGQLISSSGSIGFFGEGQVDLSGPGSAWSVANLLQVRSGSLNLSNGAKLSVGTLSITGTATLRLLISDDPMLVVGNATTPGSIPFNNGTISLIAGPGLAPGSYHPIQEYAGRAMSLPGVITPIGGSWDSASKTFTPAITTALSAGEVHLLGSGERLSITEPASGQQVGVSFGTVGSGVSFSASPMSSSQVDALVALLRPDQSVASAWDFSTNYSGTGEVLVSMDVGAGIDAEDVTVWHLTGGVWSQVTPPMLTVSHSGQASLMVTSFSGYALAVVPEPAAWGILTVGALLSLGRRRRR